MPTLDIYIGDGVYAAIDECSVTLRTERYGETHFIWLDEEMLTRLFKKLGEEWGTPEYQLKETQDEQGD